MTITYEAVRDFLYREARYLDDRQWDEWLELYAPDATFWMPSWDDNDELTEDLLGRLRDANISEIQTLYTNDLDQGAYISQTLRIDDTAPARFLNVLNI